MPQAQKTPHLRGVRCCLKPFLDPTGRGRIGGENLNVVVRGTPAKPGQVFDLLNSRER